MKLRKFMLSLAAMTALLVGAQNQGFQDGIEYFKVDQLDNAKEILTKTLNDAETDRARTEKSFFVPKSEIVGNDYDLSINKYKKTEYKPVEYSPTSEILSEINALETEIQSGLKELEDMLKWA